MKLGRQLILLVLAVVLPLVSVQADDIKGSVGYNKGFYIKTEDGNYKLRINGLAQPQFQFLSLEQQDNVNTFQLRRGRIYFSGNAFSPDLTYKFSFDFVSGRANTSREGSDRLPSLKEAWINYQYSDAIGIRFGQLDGLGNVEDYVSNTRQQFVDRSFMSDVFTYAYDLGVAVHGTLFDDIFEYYLFVINDGDHVNSTNFNKEMAVGTFLTFNILGHAGDTIADLDNSQNPQLAVNLSGSTNSPGNTNDNIYMATSSVQFRYLGFSFLGEGTYGRNQTKKTNIYGFLGEAGYFLIPKHLEVAARFVGIVPTASATGTTTNGYEYGGAINYYFFGHNLKLQTDYTFLKNSPLSFGGATFPTSFAITGNSPGFILDKGDQRFRVQLQLYF